MSADRVPRRPRVNDLPRYLENAAPWRAARRRDAVDVARFVIAGDPVSEVGLLTRRSRGELYAVAHQLAVLLLDALSEQETEPRAWLDAPERLSVR